MCGCGIVSFERGSARSMEYRKFFHVLVGFILALGVFANSALADVCFCGQSCSHGLRPEARMKAHIHFHMRCPDNQCKSCAMEKGQTVLASKSASRRPNVHMARAVAALSTPVNLPFTFYVFGTIGSSHQNETAMSSPAYLQNSSLLC